MAKSLITKRCSEAVDYKKFNCDNSFTDREGNGE